MSKYDFIKDKNIVPVHKILTLEYETEYSGQTEKLEIRVYPFTVEEKLRFKNSSSEGTKLLKMEDEEKQKEGEKLLEDSTYEAVYSVLLKDDKEVTMEHVKKIPNAWLDKIIFKALEFEGITQEDISEKSKKELNKL